MNQIDLLNQIKKYLTRYQLLVKINTVNNEYDINIHSENVLIPILNLVFGTDLRNTNYEVKNAESIDLIDETKKLAIQVTSTYKINKVKNTLEKLLKSDYKKKVEELYIYVLTEKQSSYSQEAINKIKGKFPFNAKRHILDATDLYLKIKEQNNFENIKQIAQLLESQFSDISITNTFSFQQFDEFKTLYKEKCLTNFSRLNFFGLSISKKPREVELYSLFVSPTFKGDNTYNEIEYKFKSENFERILQIGNISKTNNEIKPQEFFYNIDSDFFKSFEAFEFLSNNLTEVNNKDHNFKSLYSNNKNLVIIGNPGAGKSSMVKYSICKILEEDTSIFDNPNIYNFLPFRIELHKYNQSKILKKVGIVEYLKDLLSEEYQIIIKLENLEKLLNFFPTLIYFDGLDEIFDVQERVSVRNDIENFLITFSNAKIIVTSRFESYEEVSLNSKDFDKLIVNDFNDYQVEEYVNNWYELEESNENVRKEEIKNCLIQLKTVDSELKYNPLLLSLILILYRNELEIPTSKLQIYEGCTHTIVDTRDTKEKKLKINLKIGNKISVFSSLAYWQFSKRGKSQNFNFNDIRNHIKDYLLNKKEFDDDYLATEAAEEFLDFAKTRSIYFENKFTHKTFQEYFTAYYIFSNYFSKPSNHPEFKKILSNYIGLSSWAVVLELLICKIDAQMIDYEIVDEIIDNQIDENRADAILFFLQIVKYLKNVSRNKFRFLVEQSIITCFEPTIKLKESKIDVKEAIFNHLISLYSLEKYDDLIEEVFQRLIEDKTLKEKELSIFAYEFSIVSGKTSLLKILKENLTFSQNEYIFILSHFPLFHTEDTYLASLSKFISEFGLNSITNIYRSVFNQKIFFGSNKFNWCASFLFRTDTSILTNKRKLLKQGVTSAALNNSVSKISAIINLEPYDLKNLITNSKDANTKNFLKVIYKTYYPASTNYGDIPSQKFYDKFYINKNKSRH